MFLAIFEFLGTSELLVILVVALIIFGPRKLPQLSRQLGRSLSEFKRASEDFKRTWEKEVEMEKFEEEGRMARSMLQDEDASSIKETQDSRQALDETLASVNAWGSTEPVPTTVARSTTSNSATTDEEASTLATETTAPETSTKRDWL